MNIIKLFKILNIIKFTFEQMAIVKKIINTLRIIITEF